MIQGAINNTADIRLSGGYRGWTHGNPALDRLWRGKRRGVIDLELIKESVRVEKAESPDDMQISIPAEHASRHAIRAAGFLAIIRF